VQAHKKDSIKLPSGYVCKVDTNISDLDPPHPQDILVCMCKYAFQNLKSNTIKTIKQNKTKNPKQENNLVAAWE
jgi:hypothetical protein